MRLLLCYRSGQKNGLAGVKRMVDVLLLTAKQKNYRFISHIRHKHGTFFERLVTKQAPAAGYF